MKNFILTVLSLFLVVGCTRGPSDLPKLYSIAISVTMSGQPVDGALVACYPEDGGQWFAGGTTGKNGTVHLKTKGLYDGIPLGQYKVTVMKSQEAPDSKPERYKAVRIVHARFEDQETTPLTCTIEKNTKNITFEVEPAPPNDRNDD